MVEHMPDFMKSSHFSIDPVCHLSKDAPESMKRKFEKHFNRSSMSEKYKMMYPSYKEPYYKWNGEIVERDSAHKQEYESSDSVTSDGGPGSGNHGHEGVEGQLGGSAPSGADPAPYKGVGEKTRKLIEKRKKTTLALV